MKFIIVIAVSLMFMSEGVASEIADLGRLTLIEGAKKFKDVEGKFEIKFAGTPTITSDEVDTDLGKIQMKSFMYEITSEEVQMVAYNDYPKDMITEDSRAEMLEGGKSGALSSLGIENLDVDEEITLGKNKGIRFEGNNGTYYVKYNMYLIENRLYQVAILKTESYPDKSTSDAFFKSFKLTK